MNTFNWRAVLDPIELEYLDLLMRGFLKKEIAEKMGYDPVRISSIARDVRNKLHSKTDMHAVATYLGYEQAHPDY